MRLKIDDDLIVAVTPLPDYSKGKCIRCGITAELGNGLCYKCWDINPDYVLKKGNDVLVCPNCSSKHLIKGYERNKNTYYECSMCHKRCKVVNNKSPEPLLTTAEKLGLHCCNCNSGNLRFLTSTKRKRYIKCMDCGQTHFLFGKKLLSSGTTITYSQYKCPKCQTSNLIYMNFIKTKNGLEKVFKCKDCGSHLRLIKGMSDLYIVEKNTVPCPLCKSRHTHKRGKEHNSMDTRQRYECNDCRKSFSVVI